MNNFFKDYFYFNNREKRGILVLLVLILAIFSSNFFFPALNKSSAVDSVYFNKLIALYDSLKKNDTDSLKSQEKLYFPFDPNGLSFENWTKLGLSHRQIQIIKNYEEKGGRFYKKADLKKIYSIDENLYNKLEPYIAIKPRQVSQKKNVPAKNTQNTFLQIELNTADSTQLTKVRGIGPVFASRILKFRNLLGGFYTVDQLLEVYGMDTSKFVFIRPNFMECDHSKIRQININTASFPELLRHPYISYDYTVFIVDTRRKKAFSKPEQVFNPSFISKSSFEKLLPYLRVE